MTQHGPNTTPGSSTGKASASDDRADVTEIEAEIDQTRNAISGDLRTLGERLDPTHLKQEAKEVIVEAKNVAVETLHEAKNVATSTFRDVKDNAVDTVNQKVDELRQNVYVAEREALGFLRENAVPLALIGLGVSWFVANRRQSDRRWEGEYGRRDDGWRYPERRGFHPMDEARSGASRFTGGAREAASEARSRAGQWAETAGNRAGQVADRVRDYAQRELDQVGGVARNAEQRLTESAYRARDFAGRELRQARDYSRQLTDVHPLAVGAAAVAAGIGIGLLLPSTRPEQELLGPRRERLFEGAKDTAQQIAQNAKHAAREVKDTLSHSVNG